MNIAEATLSIAQQVQAEIHANAWFDGTTDRFLRVNIDNVTPETVYDYLYLQKFTMLSIGDVHKIAAIAQKEENESFYLLKRLGLKKSQRILIREFNRHRRYNNPVELAKDCGAPKGVIENIKDNYTKLRDIIDTINWRIYSDLKRYNQAYALHHAFDRLRINIDTIIIAPEKVLRNAGISVIKDDPVIVSRIYSANIPTKQHLHTCVVLGAWGAEKKVLDELLALENPL